MKTIDASVERARNNLRHAEDEEEYHAADATLRRVLALWRAHTGANAEDREIIAAIAREIVSDF
jgi:hypothetical protein